MSDIRVLIVDDSPTVCSIIKQGLSRAAGIEVIGTAPNPFVARDMIVNDPPDVVTLDIEMPRMDGLTFLRKLMKHFPLPVLVVSSLTADGSQKAMEALACGAVGVIEKDLSDKKRNEFMLDLVRGVRSAAQAKVKRASFSKNRTASNQTSNTLPAISAPGDMVLAIGSSTGGTEALARILEKMPANSPATVIVQHIPAGFTAQLANRLDGLSAMTVREAVNGEFLQQGTALFAPGDQHFLLVRMGKRLKVELRSGPRVSGHKPSVDILFRSVAKAAGSNAIGVILTGMGKDGAQSLLEMRNQGAFTIAQDEESCVVYGMPREAAEIGAVEKIVPLAKIPRLVCDVASAGVRA
ncbi:MAG: chemotaxis response regulator protein-glutamate methylesterase [Gemmatimonadales bacterium]|nr:chemotaxis response regulator protein-glutamate methylesterase [Gemmatimonadales bacterium]